jgi:hypothetical protein
MSSDLLGSGPAFLEPSSLDTSRRQISHVKLVFSGLSSYDKLLYISSAQHYVLHSLVWVILQLYGEI